MLQGLNDNIVGKSGNSQYYKYVRLNTFNNVQLTIYTLI